jgi:hypothetical protein
LVTGLEVIFRFLVFAVVAVNQDFFFLGSVPVLLMLFLFGRHLLSPSETFLFLFAFLLGSGLFLATGFLQLSLLLLNLFPTLFQKTFGTILVMEKDQKRLVYFLLKLQGLFFFPTIAASADSAFLTFTFY